MIWLWCELMIMKNESKSLQNLTELLAFSLCEPESSPT